MQSVLKIMLLMGIVSGLSAQSTVDFENFNLPLDTFLNDSGLSGAFVSAPISLPNRYSIQWDTWEGWAISTETDVLTPGYQNQYSAIGGGGFGSSVTYATAYAYTPAILRLQQSAIVQGLYVSNSTYAYWSMKDGDAFSKKFGGETGDDPDFFKITVRKYQNGQLDLSDSVEAYLADYRFSNNATDYILEDWTYVSLSELDVADSLSFALSSSDNGVFGMNTPAYFCLDHVVLTEDSPTQQVAMDQRRLSISPNPVQNVLHLDAGPGEVGRTQILDFMGRCVLDCVGQEELGVWMLPSGAYLLHMENREGLYVKRFVKE